MIKRCYDERMLMKSPQYRGCSVCEEWRYFSNFKRWFSQHYVDGWALDKECQQPIDTKDYKGESGVFARNLLLYTNYY